MTHHLLVAVAVLSACLFLVKDAEAVASNPRRVNPNGEDALPKITTLAEMEADIRELVVKHVISFSNILKLRQEIETSNKKLEKMEHDITNVRARLLAMKHLRSFMTEKNLFSKQN